MENKLLKSALWYAKHGWKVFPCSGKIPQTLDGFKSATTDSKQIELWWRAWPTATIGVATGKISGIVVLDVDDTTALDKYDLRDSMPTTVMSITGGGGEHYFFKYDARVKTTVGLREGIDVRADGGYVIVPPSGHKSGQEYAWVEDQKPSDMELAEAPEWMCGKEKELAKPIPNIIPKGQRDQMLTSMAGTMRNRGADMVEILSALQAMNKRCDPPLADGQVRKIAASVVRYTPGVQTSIAEIEVNVDTDFWKWDEYVDASAKAITAVEQKTICKYNITYLQDTLLGIAPSELVVIGADTGSGKTQLAMDIGMFNARAGKRVAVFPLEGDKYEVAQREIYRRVCQKYYEDGNNKTSDLTYNKYIFNMTPELEQLKNWAEEEIKKDYKDTLLVYGRKNPLDKNSVIKHLEVLHDRVDMVVIDHLHYFEFLSNSENSEITDIMKSIKKLTDKYRIPIVLVSHLRKKDKMRIFPDDDDFHGSSNIAKQGTTNILVAPITLPEFPYEDQVKQNKFTTGIRVSKARSGVSRNLIGVIEFNMDTRTYDDTYRLVRLNRYDSKEPIKELSPEQYPRWAKQGHIKDKVFLT